MHTAPWPGHSFSKGAEIKTSLRILQLRFCLCTSIICGLEYNFAELTINVCLVVQRNLETSYRQACNPAHEAKRAEYLIPLNVFETDAASYFRSLWIISSLLPVLPSSLTIADALYAYFSLVAGEKRNIRRIDSSCNRLASS